MAYTVKQLALMSGVTVRTLHFFDEMALLKPAYTRANGYRIYEEPQLLMLQQILPSGVVHLQNTHCATGVEKLYRQTDRRIEAGVRSPRHDCDWSTARR